jgi:hypothetical protein
VRGGVAEGKLSQRDVVLALTEATARRYDISVGDLYEPKEIAQELIKEVMDSSFLPTEKKLEYCEMLIEFGRELAVSPENYARRRCKDRCRGGRGRLRLVLYSA